MAISEEQFLQVFADAIGVDPSEIHSTTKFEELGGMDSIARLSMISVFESQFGPRAISPELQTVQDIPALLALLRSQGFVE
ncbi:acyl carrier protein [Planctomicrobium sp. SH661]|uniref:acyl carrier protein n=1 Tax=Planctomicrobium sp. SH661 TaxID=3448124 RepID=UPI003F5BDA79